jgi:tape measure domain-containing protein
MADDFNKLAVLIEANTRSYERSMAKLQSSTNAAFGKIERQSLKLDSTFNRMAGSLGRIGAGLAAGLSIGSAVKFADAFTRVENSLKVAGLAGTELANVQERLFQIAQKNGSSFEALAGLYGKLSLSQSALGVSTSELINFTDTIGTALKVSGVSAEQASGALLQLGQALGSGTVRAEEFNSILEGAPAIAQAAAAGLKEAGGQVAVLRQLINDGAVSSQVFFRSIEAGADMLKGRAAAATDTMSQAMQRLDNAFTLFVGNLDDATGGSEALAGALNNLAAGLSATAEWFAKNKDSVRDWKDAIRDSYGAIEGWAQRARDAIGVSKMLDQTIGTIGDGPIWNQPIGKQTGNAITEMFGGRGDYSFLPSANGAFVAGDPRVKSKPGSLPAARKSSTVSISDSRPSTSSGSSSSYPDFKQISREALSAKDSTLQLYEAADRVSQKSTMLAATMSDAFSGLALDLIKGKSAGDALSSTLDKVAEQMMSQAIQQGIGMLISGLTGGMGGGMGGFGGGNMAGYFGGGGGFASLLSFGGPRAKGGPVSTGKAYLVGEKGPELFVPSMEGAIKPNGAGAGGGMVNNISIDARGAQAGVGEEIRRALADYDRQSLSRHVANHQQARKRRAI